MYDHKGFSIYIASIKIALVKTFQWLGVRACDKHGSIFKVRHSTTTILAEKIRKAKDITVALPFWFSWVFISSEN